MYIRKICPRLSDIFTERLRSVYGKMMLANLFADILIFPTIAWGDELKSPDIKIYLKIHNCPVFFRVQNLQDPNILVVIIFY